MSSYEIQQIKRSYSISDYLSNQTITPTHTYSNYSIYRCPMPHHTEDKTPSFYVYHKLGYEDFYCFGCGSAGSIINFIADYEQIGVRKAIKRLSDELNIDIEEVLDAAVREAKESLSGNASLPPDEALIQSLYISSILHDFLLKVNKSIEELELCERIFALVDKYVYAENVDELRNISNQLESRLNKRYKQWLKNNEENCDIS